MDHSRSQDLIKLKYETLDDLSQYIAIYNNVIRI